MNAVLLCYKLDSRLGVDIEEQEAWCIICLSVNVLHESVILHNCSNGAIYKVKDPHTV